MTNAEARIEALGLVSHPEGGFYRETHRSQVVLPRAAVDRHSGDRVAMTSILFLLLAGQRSAWHRMRSEELWVFHEGDPLRLRMSANRDSAEPEARVLGGGGSGTLQVAVPPGWWQDAEVLDGPEGYALVGCVVAPGFEFDDFEMA